MTDQPRSETAPTRPWYEEFFEEGYFETYGVALAQVNAEREVDFLVRALDLGPGMRVLDLCCGYGRHAVPLARRGLRVTGLDLSPRLLGRADQAARAAGVDITWVRRDMRDLPWTAEFEAVLNIYSSFGYFEEDAENGRVLAAVAGALVPGGRLALSVASYPCLMRRFQPQSWVEGRDGWVVLESSRMDWARSILEMDCTIVRPDGSRRTARHCLRLFPPHELLAWLSRAGLEPEATYGSLDGSPFTLKSPAFVVVARKGGRAPSPESRACFSRPPAAAASGRGRGSPRRRDRA